MAGKARRSRAWLEPRSGAEVDSYIVVTKHDWGHVELKISDCNRRVEIGFYPQRLKYSLKKLDRMRAMLDKAEEFLREAAEEGAD